MKQYTAAWDFRSTHRPDASSVCRAVCVALQKRVCVVCSGARALAGFDVPWVMAPFVAPVTSCLSLFLFLFTL